MINIKKSILFFSILTLFFLNVAFVSACSCIAPSPPQEALSRSSAVFAGKVVGIDTPSRLFPSSDDPVKVKFEVSKTWKGPSFEIIVLKTAKEEVSCGFSFEKGKKYLVYALGKESDLKTSICSRTKVLNKAKKDLNKLGKGNSPQNSGSNMSGFLNNGFSSLFFGILIIILAGIVLIFLKRK